MIILNLRLKTIVLAHILEIILNISVQRDNGLEESIINILSKHLYYINNVDYKYLLFDKSINIHEMLQCLLNIQIKFKTSNCVYQG